jgi:hypothetical protein
MKKFHAPSFLLGVAVAATAMAARERLRPVAVEIGALGVHLAKVGRSLLERQREHLQDLAAEVEQRVRERTSGRRRSARAADAAGLQDGPARGPV